MKKYVLLLSTLALVFMFVGCNSAKSDGKKLGKKYCECQKLADDDKDKKAEKCWKEFRKESKKLEKKYKKHIKKEDEVYDDFTEAFDDAKDDCDD